MADEKLVVDEMVARIALGNAADVFDRQELVWMKGVSDTSNETMVRESVEKLSLRLAALIDAKDRKSAAERSLGDRIRDDIDALVMGPVTHDFWEGVRVEREFQRAKWGSVHDRNKAPPEWFWLVGYLAGKALAAQLAGDLEKARHHTISAAAALSHWYDAVFDPHDPERSSDLERAIGEGE